MIVVSLLTKIRSLRSGSVIRYGLTNLLPRSMAVLSALVLTPLAIDRLGILEYGIWALATLIPTLVSSPDFGITSGVVNEMASVHRKKGHLRDERGRLFGLRRFLWLVSLSWMILGSVVITWYVFVGKAQPELNSSILYSAMMLSLAIFVLGIPPSLWGRVQLAQERGHEYLLWEGVGRIISFFGSLVILIYIPNLFLLIIFSLLPVVLTAYLNEWQYVKTELSDKGHSILSSRRILYENMETFKSGKYFFVFQLSFLIGTAIDPFLVNRFLGTRDVAYLIVARRPFEALPLFVTLFSTALWPVFHRMHAERRIKELYKIILTLVSGSLAVYVVFSSLIIIFRDPIYSYLSQASFKADPFDLMCLALYFFSSTCVIIFSNYLNAVELLSVQMWILLLSSCFGIIVKIFALFSGELTHYLMIACLSYFFTAFLPMAWTTFKHINSRYTIDIPHDKDE